MNMFDELIDVAVQAMRDGVIFITFAGKGDLEVQSVDDRNITNAFYESDEELSAQTGILWIKSLYTETFVIEKGEDILKIRSRAIIELANGNKCTVQGVVEPLLEVSVLESKRLLNILTLKGATVTQERTK